VESCECCFSRKENLREMKVKQKNERRQMEEYDRQSQLRRETLAASFEREIQVLLLYAQIAASFPLLLF